jgi:hypothetical protein
MLGVLLGVLVLAAGGTVIALTSGSLGAAAAPPAPRTSSATPVATTPPRVATSPAAESPAAVSPRPPSVRTGSIPSKSRPATVSAPGAAPVVAPAAGTDSVTFVQRYYALLPGNTDAAFALLGPRARSQAGGVVGFKTFYARMQSVTVQNPRSVGGNTVTAVVRFVQKDGTSSNEPYRFVMVTDGSARMIMESFGRQ